MHVCMYVCVFVRLNVYIIVGIYICKYARITYNCLMTLQY